MPRILAQLWATAALPLVVFIFSTENCFAAEAPATNESPRLSAPLNVFAENGRALVVYERELRFIEMAPNMSAERGPNGILHLVDDGMEVDASAVPANKKMRFQHGFDLFPSTDSKRFLVCTSPTAAKTSPVKGGIAEFCGVLAISGEVVFEFKPNRKTELLAPFIFSQAGDYAVVIVGEAVAGDEGTRVANPREVWTWEAPSKVLKHAGPWKDGPPKNPAQAINDLRRKFRRKP